MTDAATVGCTFVVGKVRRWDAKARAYKLVPVHCNKLPTENSQYCPRHQAIAEAQQVEPRDYSAGK